MRRGAALLAMVALAGCGGSSGGGKGPRTDPAQEQRRSETAPRTQAAGPRTAGTAAAPLAPADVTTHLRALQRIADRNDGTRAAGTPGDRETADYIADQLRGAGWRVRLQQVRFPFFAQRGQPVVDGLRNRTDFSVLAYSPGGEVTAKVVPLDTQACDVAALAPVRAGEIALVARGRCTFRRKALNAQRAGAAALLVVDAKAERPISATLQRPTGVKIPVLSLTARAAARLARSDAPVHVKVDTVSEVRTTRNVLADTAAATRVAMAGAHLDSVEAGPGINDDGSGVSALLAAAPRLAHRPGLRLGFWAAEELGLYGSRHYVRALPRAERRRIAAYVNLDMVGSPHPRQLVYDTDDVVERALRAALPGRTGEVRLGGASDHAPFARAGVRVGGIFTGASARTDPCYHRPCDTIRNVDRRMVARAAQAVAVALPRLAG